LSDRIVKIGSSLVQHGKANDRVYLMKLADADAETIPDRLVELANENGYSKVIGKIPASAKPLFAKRGFVEEAQVPRFYHGTESGVFVSRFLSERRLRDDRAQCCREVLAAARLKAAESTDVLPSPALVCRQCLPADAEEMAELYKVVFETYPFPIHCPTYLRETMESHVVYFGAWRHDRLVGLSSAETDRQALNVEMTDFATLPEFRGSGVATILLGRMERVMHRQGFHTAYTIARSLSFGMNITFSRMGYAYSGTLVNNTDICGSFESMNIWHKPLRSRLAGTPDKES
jgi:putative beta-lysine N-acetyltransferase